MDAQEVTDLANDIVRLSMAGGLMKGLDALTSSQLASLVDHLKNGYLAVQPVGEYFNLKDAFHLIILMQTRRPDLLKHEERVAKLDIERDKAVDQQNNTLTKVIQPADEDSHKTTLPIEAVADGSGIKSGVGSDKSLGCCEACGKVVQWLLQARAMEET